jgi:hypothetical protein
MNERIRELAEQATSHMPGHPPYDGLTFDVFDKEKFAELIVRECNSKLDNIGVIDRDSRTIAMKVISEHFGVEE